MPKTIPILASLETLFREQTYTIAQIEAYPIARPFLPRALEVLERWNALNAQELQLLRQEVAAQAFVDRVDGDLDPVVEDLAALVLRLVGSNRKHPLYLFFFGRYRPSDLVKPVLGVELTEVKAWPPALKGSEHAELRPVGDRVEALVTEADQAVAQKAGVARQWNELYLLGAHKVFVDDFNAWRRDLHADLSKLPQTPEGKALPHDFADRFFLRDRRRTASTPELTIGEIRTQLADLQAQLAQRELEQKEREEAAARMQADEAELAALEKRTAELRGKLGR
jgi:hypothetical protein